MTDSDNESGAISDASEEVESLRQATKDAISDAEGETESDSTLVSSSSPNDGNEKEAAAMAQAISSEEESVSEDDKEERNQEDRDKSRSRSIAEEGETISSSNSTPSKRTNNDDSPLAKKQKSETRREDLEEGELTSDSEEEKEQQQTQYYDDIDTSKNVFKRNKMKNHPRIDFPRKVINATQQRRKPEDYGICKFHLRGSCTWDNKCKYTHPTGAQKILWMAECGISDPTIGLNIKADKDAKIESKSPKLEGSVFQKRRRTISKRSNGSHKSHSQRESPKPSAISSESSRSPSPIERKRFRRSRSISSVSRSSEERRRERSKSRDSYKRRDRSKSRTLDREKDVDDDISDFERRRARSSSRSEMSRSRSPIERKTETTLGALLKKKRLEAMKKNPSPEKKSEQEQNEMKQETKPQSRGEAIRKLFDKNPDNEPEIYKKPRKSPTPELISSSGEDDSDVDDSPKRPARSESPMEASTEAEV